MLLDGLDCNPGGQFYPAPQDGHLLAALMQPTWLTGSWNLITVHSIVSAIQPSSYSGRLAGQVGFKLSYYLHSSHNGQSTASMDLLRLVLLQVASLKVVMTSEMLRAFKIINLHLPARDKRKSRCYFSSILPQCVSGHILAIVCLGRKKSLIRRQI